MNWEYSRRDFLAGVLATGTLAAVGTYFSPGGRPAPSIRLRMVTGADPTGARDLLINTWNRANPNAQVETRVIEGSTFEQRSEMISAVKNGGADILNLDIINIPHFQKNDYIAPIDLNADDFLDESLLTSRLGDPSSTTFWAVPFNADVGMLFQRKPPGEQRTGEDGPALTAVIDDPALDGSHQFAGQLRPESSSSYEAFAVNVLEHALSRDPDILTGNTALPASELERWQHSLQPVRDAVKAGRVTLCNGEDDTEEEFRTAPRTFMRNWPVKYRILQKFGDADAAKSQIRVGKLPVGVLGGQSLALVKASPNQSQATALIHFLTSLESQKILASYGLAATRTLPYTDQNLKAFIPHLETVRGAIEDARPRPIHPNYAEFSAAFVGPLKRMLVNDEDLTTAFVEAIQKTLK